MIRHEEAGRMGRISLGRQRNSPWHPSRAREPHIFRSLFSLVQIQCQCTACSDDLARFAARHLVGMKSIDRKKHVRIGVKLDMSTRLCFSREGRKVGRGFNDTRPQIRRFGHVTFSAHLWPTAHQSILSSFIHPRAYQVDYGVGLHFAVHKQISVMQ